jgi:hypothetical protein
MFRTVKVTFYATAVVMTTIIIETLAASRYHVAWGIVVVLLSYMPGAMNLGLIGYRMFSWFRLKRNIATLLIAVTFLVAAAAYANMSIVNAAYFFAEDPFQTERYYADYGYGPVQTEQESVPHFSPRKDESHFALYQFTLNGTRIAYFFMWAAVIAMVRNYSKTMGKTKFLCLVILPGLIFPVQMVESLAGIFPPMFASLYGQTSLTLAGIFFGIIFFASAKSVQKMLGNDNSVSHYLNITGFGFILALTAVSPAIHVIDRFHTAFPPFAALNWAFFGLGIYLVSSGFYLSAISIARDMGIRMSIRRMAEESNKMLDTIGTAQMEEGIRENVLKITKEQQTALEDQTGLEQNLSEEDIQNYVREALEEVQKRKDK